MVSHRRFLDRGLYVEALVFFVFFLVAFGTLVVISLTQQNKWRDELVNSWNVARPGTEFPAYWNIAGRWQEKTAAETVPLLESWRLVSQYLSPIGNVYDTCTFIARVHELAGIRTFTADPDKRTASCGMTTGLVTNPEVRRKLDAAYVPNVDRPEVLFLVNAAYELSSGAIVKAFIAETSARDRIVVPPISCSAGLCGPASPAPLPSSSTSAIPSPTSSAIPSSSALPSIVPSVDSSPLASSSPIVSTTPNPTVVVTTTPQVSWSPSPSAVSSVSLIPTPVVSETVSSSPGVSNSPAVSASAIPSVSSSSAPSASSTSSAAGSASVLPTLNASLPFEVEP